MHNVVKIIISFYFILACNPVKKLSDLKSKDCGNFTIGMIEAKRLLNDQEKAKLEEQGILIQEFLFETVYQGIWKNSWNTKKLNTTPIRKLKEYKSEDKVSEGIILKEIAEDNTPCNLIVQSIIEIDDVELSSFGKVVNYKNKYYRIETQKKYIDDIAQHPCVKHVSLMKSLDIPDIKN
ncbi:MAG: hypothetical protein HOP11_10325 [Saprospiraceae bacterium]|nr:hypothetical protein [Saprospiraceae bacterium]